MSSIHNYLSKIEAAQPINFQVLRNRLLDAGYERAEISSTFSTKKYGKSNYTIEVLDLKAFQAMQNRFRPSGDTGRVGAALDGDSHKVRVSESMLVLRSAQHPHPVVAISSAGAWIVPRQLGKIGVIVENLENFLRADETLLFAAALLGIDQTEIELIFGSGNQVTNVLNGSVLGTFSRLYCMFDVDMGGLRMFASLRAMLPANPPTFLYPPDVEQHLLKSRYPLSAQQRQDVIQYRHLSPETDQLIVLMRSSNQMLEQETYLAPVPSKE